MTDFLIEVIVNASEAAALDIGSRDEIEDPLEAALASGGFGTITGGGSGLGVYVIDVEVLAHHLPGALNAIKEVLRALYVPASTRIKSSTPVQFEYGVYDEVRTVARLSTSNKNGG